MLVCVALGFVIERVAYRPLRRAPRLAPLITAIGVSILLQYSAALIWGKQYISMPELIKPAQIAFGGAQFTELQAIYFPARLRGHGGAAVVHQGAAAWAAPCAPPSRIPMSRD